MGTPRKVATIATTAVLALMPAAALAATKPPTSKAKAAHATCVALKKKEGVKRFDARFGAGTKHTHAMARCVTLHTKAASKKSMSS